MENEQGVPVVATPAATPSATPQGKLTSRKRGRPAGSTIEAKRSSKRIAVTIKVCSDDDRGLQLQRQGHADLISQTCSHPWDLLLVQMTEQRKLPGLPARMSPVMLLTSALSKQTRLRPTLSPSFPIQVQGHHGFQRLESRTTGQLQVPHAKALREPVLAPDTFRHTLERRVMDSQGRLHQLLRLNKFMKGTPHRWSLRMVKGLARTAA
ncbi:hypothetical protein H2199_009081 [Coniosporium tulheliwenetii]|uniref:Uncharacterized protein n=1 Tax=Coniosporium tulheliwenetii TaxID=3383036 RepID=A0ACC2YG31_9PEZI|nr:hypothetical protein H2199_009081 [Cladosporium sp. JES 115]